MIKWKVNDGNYLHSNEIGTEYARDSKRVYLHFDNGDRTGYLFDEITMVSACGYELCTRKPLLEVMPRRLYDASRIQDLCRALYRYSSTGINPSVMIECSKELTERLEDYRKYKD